MSSSGYTAWSVTAGEVPTTAMWNILGSNDASFNTGNGINDGAIISRHLGAHSVTNTTQVMLEVAPTATTFTNSWTTIPGWSGSFTTSGGLVIMTVDFSFWNGTGGNTQLWRIVLNGSGYVPNATGVSFFLNPGSTHMPQSRIFLIPSLLAATYAVTVQLYSTANTGHVDTGDFMTMNTIEVFA